MFDVTMKPDADFASKMYDIMFDIANKAMNDRDQINELPYLLSREQLAKHIFNVSSQTLENHIVHRPDFKKVQVGQRVLYPKDEAIKWIRKHTETVEKIAPNKIFGIG